MSITDEGFWSTLYGSLAADFGYTPAQVREMTLHDVYRLRAYLADRPSLRALVEAIALSLGIDFKPPEERKPMSYREAAMFFRATGGRIEGLITDG